MTWRHVEDCVQFFQQRFDHVGDPWLTISNKDGH